jgi:hypothetical protein
MIVKELFFIIQCMYEYCPRGTSSRCPATSYRGTTFDDGICEACIAEALGYAKG